MRIVVTHLTRMAPGFVCIAGIEPASGRHVRPVVPGRRLRRGEISIEGSEITIGTELDLGRTTPVPSPPEIEDHAFDPSSARRIRNLSALELAGLLRSVACPSLADIFGADLQADGRTCSIAVGSGAASLGVLAPPTAPSLTIDSYDKVKLVMLDGSRSMAITVADLRLYEGDQTTPNRTLVSSLSSQLATTPTREVFLSVGLSRPFAKDGREPRHWLQINNVHVFSRPA
jgi:hypothetical protein